MHSLLPVALLCLTPSVFASPIAQPEGTSFKVERTPRADHIPDGPAALRRAYTKYNAPNHVSEETGKVNVKDIEHGFEYIAPVKIGGQTIYMDFDTGSSNMWVMSTALPAQQRAGRTVYNPAKSSTYKPVSGGSFSISYGDSSWAKGKVGKDTVSVGGAKVTNQVFGLATQISSSFESDKASNGLLGLGFKGINTIEPRVQNTFFDNVAPHLEQPIFTTWLRKDGVSEYEFGAIDHSKYTGSLVKASVDPSQGYWMFDVPTFTVGNGKVQGIPVAGRAIADTGTSLMLVSDHMAKMYYSHVSGVEYSSYYGGYMFPCAASLPDLHVSVGDHHSITIPGSLFNYGALGVDSSTGKTMCFGGLQSNGGLNFQIWGDVFLKSHFVVYDHSGPSISFAKAA